MELFVDAVNGWKGGSLILERLRVEKAEVTQTVFDDIVRAIRETPVHVGVLGSAVWNFSDRAIEFYTFLMPRLTGELASLSNGMSKEVGENCNGRNGLECTDRCAKRSTRCLGTPTSTSKWRSNA